jgi:hypothetical protein
MPECREAERAGQEINCQPPADWHPPNAAAARRRSCCSRSNGASAFTTRLGYLLSRKHEADDLVTVQNNR